MLCSWTFVWTLALSYSPWWGGRGQNWPPRFIGMIRFANPGSNIDGFTRIFQALVEVLGVAHDVAGSPEGRGDDPVTLTIETTTPAPRRGHPSTRLRRVDFGSRAV